MRLVFEPRRVAGVQPDRRAISKPGPIRLRPEVPDGTVAVTWLPTRYVPFEAHVYRAQVENHPHVALLTGDLRSADPVLVRVHSEWLTGDVFGSSRCDCGAQLQFALARIADEGRGVRVYLRLEGRGIGLTQKLRAYRLQDQGQDTAEANATLGFKADHRDYAAGVRILAELGVWRIRLMTNNPEKITGLGGYGITIVERVGIEVPATGFSRRYLRTKKEKFGHFLHGVWIYGSRDRRERHGVR
jgi:3,4-dihydroxy 2-butanone 4-phosphate synthase/GTP cyclohydrolase II